jgi:hypothetical protein
MSLLTNIFCLILILNFRIESLTLEKENFENIIEFYISKICILLYDRINTYIILIIPYPIK